VEDGRVPRLSRGLSLLDRGRGFKSRSRGGRQGKLRRDQRRSDEYLKTKRNHLVCIDESPPRCSESRGLESSALASSPALLPNSHCAERLNRKIKDSLFGLNCQSSQNSKSA